MPNRIIFLIITHQQIVLTHLPLVPHTCVSEAVQIATLVQIITCRLFGAKPFSKQCHFIVNWTVMNKCQWNFDQNKNSSFTTMYLKISSGKWRPFCAGGDELTPLVLQLKHSGVTRTIIMLLTCWLHYWLGHQGPFLIIWLNFNPRMDK